MLLVSLIMGLATFLAFMLAWIKLPYGLRKFLVRHSTLTDLTATVLSYLLHGQTATAILAAGIVAVSVSVCLKISEKSEEYEWVYSLVRLTPPKYFIKEIVDESEKGL
jgi:hypothetical protein